MVDDAGAAEGLGRPSPGGRGRGRSRGARGGKAENKEWLPVTKLGPLVKDMKIKSLQEIHLFSLPIAESGIIDFFLKDEVLKIMPVQKHTLSGQWTRFKAFVATGDYNRHVSLDVKCCKAVATAIHGAIILAKLSIVPVQRGC
uniref:40S ribosomal protein S2 n=1 Tax=Capra hircus TaxID=9925 RepID=A0A8C2NMJ3_CAPHI